MVVPFILMRVIELGLGMHSPKKYKENRKSGKVGAWKVQPLGEVVPIPAEEQKAALETYHAIAERVARTEVGDEPNRV